MFVEEIRSKYKGKEYRSYLIRESYREGMKVKHRTLANISHLPLGCILAIKNYFNEKPESDFSKQKILNFKEYGASQALLKLASCLELEALICRKKTCWRKDILVLVIAKIIFSERMFEQKTQLWEMCGNCRPSFLYFLPSLRQLVRQKETIISSLKEKYFNQEKNLYFLMHNGYYLTKANSFICVSTNLEGCPWNIELVSNSEEKKLIASKENGIFISDGQIVNQADKFITSLTLFQIGKLFAKHPSIYKLLSKDDIQHDIMDPDDPKNRFIFFYNDKNINVLQTSILRDEFTALQLIEIYKRFILINDCFQFSFATFSAKNYNEDLKQIDSFFCLLSYYLIDYLHKQLSINLNSTRGQSDWKLIIEKLEEIRYVTLRLENFITYELKGTPNEEQEEILSSLGIDEI